MSDFMIFEVSLSVGAVRKAIAEMGDFACLVDDDQFEIEIGLEQGEVDEACSMCSGSGPEPQVDPRLIADFIAAIHTGDMMTARALVGRVFEDGTDIRAVDNALCRCAA